MNYNLLILFTTTHPNTVGNACRLKMIEYLIKNFNAIILTNQYLFLSNIINYKYIIDISSIYITPNIKNYFKLKYICNYINNKYNNYNIFLFQEDVLLNLYLKNNIYCYIHQWGRRDYIKKININNILYTINENRIIRGFSKSKINFVVSKPIIKILNEKGINNTVYIPHGIEIKYYKNPLLFDIHLEIKKYKDNNYFIVTYTGWVSYTRGLLIMLESLYISLKKNKKILLVIAGADKEYSLIIDQFASRYNIQNNIINYGIVDNIFIPGILYYSDVCLSYLDDLPAFKISPPQKIIEYFAAGKPVICNDIEPHKWIVENNKTGFITQYDPVEVAEKILTLSNNKELLLYMSQAAANEAKKYDINVVYGKMVKLIKESLLYEK